MCGSCPLLLIAFVNRGMVLAWRGMENCFEKCDFLEVMEKASERIEKKAYSSRKELENE